MAQEMDVPPAHDPISSSDVVEDIPSHEIYALLVGIQPRNFSIRHKSSTGSSNETSAVMVENNNDQQHLEKHPIVPPRTLFGHAFAKSQQVPLSLLRLGPSNKGFKLLSKMGWKETDGGLGKHRQGTLVPIQTVRTKGRAGIGTLPHASQVDQISLSSKKRQRHNQQRQKDKGTKQERKKSKQLHSQHADKREMRRIRMMLRTDVTEEFEEIYQHLF